MTYYDAPHAFSQADIDLAVTIGRQLGFSIQRLRSDDARRRAEHASRLLASIVESSDDAVVSKDLNGIVTSWNQAAERTFGYTEGEMIGRPIATLIPDDRKNEEVLILERIRRGEHSRIDGVSARPLTPEPEIDGPQHGGDSAGFPPGLNQSLLQCGALSPNL
jgi:PAS domain-containing protein